MRLTVLIGIAMAFALTSCGEKSDAPQSAYPRPTAYPRVADPGTRYHAADSLPLSFPVNTAAAVSHPGPLWLDINYPRLKATIHVTITQVTPADIDRVIANRTQRAALNVAEAASSRTSDINSASFTSSLISSPETRSTPLQFVATDGSKWVVSGAAFFRDVTPSAPIDSLAPAVAIIERDLIYALSNLSARQ